MLELYKYRDLIKTLVIRDLKVRYRRSAIGFLWTMLQPLLMMLVLHVVFSTVFRFDLPNYPVYVLAGILFWNFFQQSIITSMNSLKGNAPILQKLPVPMAIFPLSTVLSGIVNLLLAMIPLFGILVVTGHPLTKTLFFLPVAILIMAAFTLGAGLLLSPLAVFFSDVIELVGVVMILLMYLTPIFYPVAIAEQHRFGWVVTYSPVRAIMEVFRDPIYLNKIPGPAMLGVSTFVAVAALVVGYIVFRRSSDRIPFYF